MVLRIYYVVVRSTSSVKLCPTFVLSSHTLFRQRWSEEFTKKPSFSFKRRLNDQLTDACLTIIQFKLMTEGEEVSLNCANLSIQLSIRKLRKVRTEMG